MVMTKGFLMVNKKKKRNGWWIYGFISSAVFFILGLLTVLAPGSGSRYWGVMIIGALGMIGCLTMRKENRE